MISIRDAAACLGHVGAMSVVSHIFGLGTTPEYTFDQQGLSVARLFSQLSGPHIHLNLIRVGSENFDWEMEVYIAEAIQYMRDRIYSQVGLGIGRIYHYGIPLAMTQGYEVIDSFDQGKTLTNQWTAHNDGIDVFLVRHITIPPSVLGISPRPGPNDKDDDKGYSGIVVDAFACVDMGGSIGGMVLSSVIAHELGHSLGLPHREDDDRALMFPHQQLGINLTAEEGRIIFFLSGTGIFKGPVRPGCA